MLSMEWFWKSNCSAVVATAKGQAPVANNTLKNLAQYRSGSIYKRTHACTDSGSGASKIFQLVHRPHALRVKQTIQPFTHIWPLSPALKKEEPSIIWMLHDLHPMLQNSLISQAFLCTRLPQWIAAIDNTYLANSTADAITDLIGSDGTAQVRKSKGPA